MTRKAEQIELTDREVRSKLRRTCYEKLQDYFDGDGLVPADEAKMAVQAASVISREDATEVHRDALMFSIVQAVNSEPAALAKAVESLEIGRKALPEKAGK